MIRVLRFSPSRLALGYIALSVLALCLFAVPLWYAWRANLSTFKAYVQGEEMQTLVDAFDRDGATGVAAAMESQAGSLPGGEIMILADPSKLRLAGNLPAWPAQVPDAPGTYGLVIDIGGGATMRVVVSHVRLPGGYHLLLGRESVLFHAFIERFWYGIAGAMVIVLVLAAAIGWLIRRALLSEVHEISRTASAIVEGDLSRRLETRSGSPELDTLARTVNGMLAQLARQNVQLEGEVAVRRQAQQALHRAHEELEGVVAQRTAQLARANEFLRLSEERYALAMTATAEGHWDWIVPTDEFYASPRMLEMYGFPPDTTFAGREDFLARFPFHPEDRLKWEQAAAAHFAGDATRFDFELRLLLRDETRWVHLTGVCLRDASGTPVRWTGAVSDITERKHATEALRLSEERYARAMDASDEGHWDVDVSTGEIFVSARMKQIFGFAADEQLGNHAEYVARAPFHPDDRQRVLDTVQALLSGTSERYEIEYRIVPRPGEIRWVRSRGKAFRDERGVTTRMSGSLTDITERKHAEEALRLSEQRYERAMLASEAGFWEWTAATDHFYASPRLLEMAGFPPGTTFAGRSDSLLRVPYHPEDLAKWNEATATLFAGKHARVEMEMRMIRSGETRWVHLDGLCTRDATGAVARWTGSVIDITERKNAEEALRRSEERFALAVAGSNEGIFDWDLAADRVFLSHRAQGLIGLEPGEPWRPRDEWSAMVRYHADDLERQRRGIRAHLAGETPAYDVEFRATLPGGDCRWFRQRGVALRDASGKAYRMAGSIEDVTDRKAADDELRVRKEELQQLTDSISDYLWSAEVAVDGSFAYRYCSPVVERITGRPPEYFIESPERWLGTIHSLDRPALAAAFQRIASGATDREDAEYRIVRPDGAVRWVRDSVRATRLEDGRIVLNGVASDITERKRVEQELHARQGMLDLAQKAARAVAFEWRIGAGEGENRWSPDLEAMYGLAPGSYDGTYDTWKKLVFPEDWPAVKAAIKRATESGDVAAEYRVVHGDGAVRWLQAKGRMFFDAEGKPARLVGFMLDVTERHQAEEELRRLERQLRQSQRLEAMGTLAGGIAHDFNNILGAILGYGEMALRGVPKGSRLRRDLGSIMTAGERGRALVERILAFSRSGVGERVAVHVEKVVGEALGLLAANLPEGVDIERRLRAGRAAALGDPTQVHQVLMNLATNAIQAMPSGGTLRVSLDGMRLDAPRVATTGTLGAGDYVALEVADSGTGMSPEILERIFDPFFTTKEVGVGTGLGLSLVHGIVTELGGAIDVASTVGEGSVFTVYLPRAGDAGDELEREEPVVPRGNRQQVLIVDDEAPLVSLATETLAELGYVPVGFTSSAAALEAFRADPERFDAVITDERMPGMSGSALIREIRGVRRAIPILLVSGYLGAAVVQRALESGADEVLKKPLSARELATSLARVLHARQVELRLGRAGGRP